MDADITYDLSMVYFKAVSYTHLDVYKRQGYLPIVGIVVLFTLFSQRMKHKKYRAAFIASIIALILPIFGYAFNGFSYANNRWAFAPVSYTHLDVYKRQGKGKGTDL